MTLRARILTTGAALTLVLLVITGVVNLAVAQVTENAETTQRLDAAAVDSRALATSLVDQETGQRGFVITGDESFLAPYRIGEQNFAIRVARLRENPAFDAQLERRLDTVVDRARRWRQVAATPEIKARRDGGPALAAELVAGGAGRTAFDEVRASANQLQRDIDARLAAARDRDRDSLVVLRTVSIVGPLSVLVVAIGTLLLMRQWVVRPVLAVRASMRRIAAGDLDVSIPQHGPPEVAALGRDAEQMRRRIVAELEATRAATEALDQHSPAVAGLRRELSSPASWRDRNLIVAGRLEAAEGVLAGDWWAPQRRPDGSTAVVIADVSGHGTEPGLAALRFRHRIGALLDTDLDLATAFARAAAGMDMPADMFLTCLCLQVDPAASELVWVNAGHPPGLLLRRGRPDTRLGSTGPLVSTLGGDWTAARTELEAGDLVVLVTDGFLEARDVTGSEYGEERLARTAAETRHRGAAVVVDECFESVRLFAHGARRDDLTCVALELLGTRPTKVRRPGDETP